MQVRKSMMALFGIICAALGSGIGAGVTAVIGNWYDPNKVADSLSTDSPVSMIEADTLANRTGAYGWVSKAAVSPADLRNLLTSTQNDRSAELPWDAKHEAVPLGVEQVVITLQGNRDIPVHIVSLTPHIESCAPAYSGTIAYTTPQGGDSTIQLETSLDDPTPIFSVLGDKKSEDDYPSREATAFFDSHSVTLKRDEVLTFQITAHLTTRMCSWDIQANEVVDGRSMNQILGKDDPWKLSGGVPLTRYTNRYVAFFIVHRGSSPSDPPYVPESARYMCARLKFAQAEVRLWPHSPCP